MLYSHLTSLRRTLSLTQVCSIFEGLPDDPPAGDFIVIDDHESAGCGDFICQIEGDGPFEFQIAFGHVMAVNPVFLV